MAEESHRSGVSDERNERTRKRFKEAAKEHYYGVRGGPYYGDTLFKVILEE